MNEPQTITLKAFTNKVGKAYGLVSRNLLKKFIKEADKHTMKFSLERSPFYYISVFHDMDNLRQAGFIKYTGSTEIMLNPDIFYQFVIKNINKEELGELIRDYETLMPCHL